MALADVWSYANAPAVIAILACLIRWGHKIDKGLNESVQNAVLLGEQIKSHQREDDLRFAEATRRLGDLEDRARWA